MEAEGLGDLVMCMTTGTQRVDMEEGWEGARGVTPQDAK